MQDIPKLLVSRPRSLSNVYLKQ